MSKLLPAEFWVAALALPVLEKNVRKCHSTERAQQFGVYGKRKFLIPVVYLRHLLSPDTLFLSLTTAYCDSRRHCCFFIPDVGLTEDVTRNVSVVEEVAATDMTKLFNPLES
ncbi:hypothetical protein XENOCAPTIV_016633 [Xenoophorus captivus]|uniref:Secreted protein n=1 Tax=Xenoophorus captivus TaxID=1517983 RepID=A0ABV0QVS8_9TELE